MPSAGDRPDLYVRGADRDLESVGPWPFLSGTAGIEVERSEAALREGVAREVRLAQQKHAGNAPLAGEDMPDRLACGPQIQLLNDLGEQTHKGARRTQQGWIASMCVDDPFGSKLDSLHGRSELITLPPRTSNSFQTGCWARAGSATFDAALSHGTKLPSERKKKHHEA